MKLIAVFTLFLLTFLIGCAGSKTGSKEFVTLLPEYGTLVFESPTALCGSFFLMTGYEESLDPNIPANVMDWGLLNSDTPITLELLPGTYDVSYQGFKPTVPCGETGAWTTYHTQVTILAGKTYTLPIFN